MKGPRKFLSEHAVNIYSARWLMLPASQLAADAVMAPEPRAVSDRCHIYLICQHPALAYSRNTFSYVGNTLQGALKYRVSGEERSLPFGFKFELVEGAVRVELSSYPHREIHTLDGNGDIVRLLPASMIGLSPPALQRSKDLGAFEVLYVGQAFGSGERSAFERLQSHSTLQKVLADAQYNAPDNEVFVFLMEYLPYRVISQIDGRNKTAIRDERDSARFYSIIQNQLTEHQQICLVEAALIRYFQPKYNEIYKDTFPSESHKILAECYKLDFSALIVEINTDEKGFLLFSASRKAAYHHIAKIDLLGKQDRQSFFQILPEADIPPDVVR